MSIHVINLVFPKDRLWDLYYFNYILMIVLMQQSQTFTFLLTIIVTLLLLIIPLGAANCMNAEISSDISRLTRWAATKS